MQVRADLAFLIGPRRGDLLFLEAHLQDPLLIPHGIKGVGAEIHQHLVYLGGIGKNRVPAYMVGLPNLHRGRQGGAEQFHGLFHDGRHRHGPLFRFLLAAEAEDLPHQIPGAIAGREDLVQVGVDFRIGVFEAGQLGITHHRPEDVVEIVGDAAGQGADGLHLLGLAELGFHPNRLRDVPSQDHVTCKFSVGHYQGADGRVHLEEVAFLAPDGKAALPDVSSFNRRQETPVGIVVLQAVL